MSFEDNIKTAMARLINDRGLDCKEVASWRDDTRSDGYCETCFYTWAVVVITYLTSKGATAEFVYNDSFSDLIRDLNDYSD